MMKRMMLGLALVAAVAVGSLATANSAEAGNCYRGGYGGFYAPTYGYGYHSSFYGHRGFGPAPVIYSQRSFYRGVPYGYGGLHGHPGFYRNRGGVNFSIGF